MNQPKKHWTKAEDKRLLRQIEAFPHNLNACFAIVAEELGRTPTSVSSHWYNTLSKKDGILNYGLVSKKKVLINRKIDRKNCYVAKNTPSIWRKLLRVIQTIIH